MGESDVVGRDFAKQIFQSHGARVEGRVAPRKKLSRGCLPAFCESLTPCFLAMEAFATAHNRACEISAFGHVIRLFHAAYLEPSEKRHKNDVADAQTIAKAAMRPTKLCLEPMTPEQQEQAIVFRRRELFVRQRSQIINALRTHLAEHGLAAQKTCGAPHEHPAACKPSGIYSGRVDFGKHANSFSRSCCKHMVARSDGSSRMTSTITPMTMETSTPTLRSLCFCRGLPTCRRTTAVRL